MLNQDNKFPTILINRLKFCNHNFCFLDLSKEILLYNFLERQWNMWIPGFGNDELRPYKRAAVTEAHRQRMALIRKTIKKY